MSMLERSAIALWGGCAFKVTDTLPPQSMAQVIGGSGPPPATVGVSVAGVRTPSPTTCHQVMWGVHFLITSLLSKCTPSVKKRMQNIKHETNHVPAVSHFTCSRPLPVGRASTQQHTRSLPVRHHTPIHPLPSCSYVRGPSERDGERAAYRVNSGVSGVRGGSCSWGRGVVGGEGGGDPPPPEGVALVLGGLERAPTERGTRDWGVQTPSPKHCIDFKMSTPPTQSNRQALLEE